MHFERKDYETCIEQCQKAVEIGRENRADFKLIAKAFARIGNAYKRLNVSLHSLIFIRVAKKYLEYPIWLIDYAVFKFPN